MIIGLNDICQSKISFCFDLQQYRCFYSFGFIAAHKAFENDSVLLYRRTLHSSCDRDLEVLFKKRSHSLDLHCITFVHEKINPVNSSSLQSILRDPRTEDNIIKISKL